MTPDMSIEEIKEFVDKHTTFDGRLALDYSESFEMRRAIEKLIKIAEGKDVLQKKATTTK